MSKKQRMQQNTKLVPASLSVTVSPWLTNRLYQMLTILALSFPLPLAFAQQESEATDPGQQGINILPTFSVVPRTPELSYYPCLQCHEFMTPNPQVRQLFSPEFRKPLSLL